MDEFRNAANLSRHEGDGNGMVWSNGELFVLYIHNNEVLMRVSNAVD